MEDRQFTTCESNFFTLNSWLIIIRSKLLQLHHDALDSINIIFPKVGLKVGSVDVRVCRLVTGIIKSTVERAKNTVEPAICEQRDHWPVLGQVGKIE